MHNKLVPKVGAVRVTWPKFKIWDPFHNFRMDKAMHSNGITLEARWHWQGAAKVISSLIIFAVFDESFRRYKL